MATKQRHYAILHPLTLIGTTCHILSNRYEILLKHFPFLDSYCNVEQCGDKVWDGQP